MSMTKYIVAMFVAGLTSTTSAQVPDASQTLIRVLSREPQEQVEGHNELYAAITNRSQRAQMTAAILGAATGPDAESVGPRLLSLLSIAADRTAEAKPELMRALESVYFGAKSPGIRAVAIFELARHATDPVTSEIIAAVARKPVDGRDQVQLVEALAGFGGAHRIELLSRIQASGWVTDPVAKRRVSEIKFQR
jgi:hypothetical protein